MRKHRENSAMAPFCEGSDGRARLTNPSFFFGAPPKANATDLYVVNALCRYRRNEDGEEVEVEGVDIFNPGPPEDAAPPFLFAQRVQRAVLEDAARVLAGSGLCASANDFMMDVWWVQGRRRSVPGFALEDICESLNLDFAYVQRKLLELARATHAKHHARQEVA